MAREKVPIIYCWEMYAGGLNIYLAATDKGALRIGLSMKRHYDAMHYFHQFFPESEFVRDFAMNRHLILAVEAVLNNRPILKNFSRDFEATPFQSMVWNALTQIPFGQTRTYGEVAGMVGRPNGARAVGQAVGKNPLPLIYP